jgi:leader peptidase (prepilin peptidase)/N-methyltransferase
MDIYDFFTANPEAYLAVIAVLSLIIGSFLNVVIYRLPVILEHNWSEECRIYLGLKPHQEISKLNLCLPNSHCPQCKNNIKPWHNIPLISYFLLRGKCAACQTRISIRYPLVEAVTCFMSVYVAWKFGFSWQALAALSFTWICISLTFIDLDHHILPDELTLLLLWIGLFGSIFSLFCTSNAAIIGAIAGYVIFALTQLTFEWATGKSGMGQGDVKFLAALGGFLGWQMLPLIIILASFTGIIFAFTHMIVKRHFKSVPLPFGPYLALAGWIAMLWGNEIMQYYYSVIL